MRHAAGRTNTSQAKAGQTKASNKLPLANSNCIDSATANTSLSLRTLFPNAKFFTSDDIVFIAVAEMVEAANPGELIAYRIGEHCPIQFSADALAIGACGILTEQLLPCPLPQCVVGDIDIALASIASAKLDRPDRRVLTIGITGTAGKTTTALMLAHVLRQAGIRTAYTTDLGECDGVIQTTPESAVPVGADLIEWLAEVADCQCGASIIEINDKALTHGRYDSVEFDLLVITGGNPSRNDFGPSGLQCALERLAADGVVITPADEPKIERVVRDAGVRMVTYATRREADVTAKIIDQSGGMSTMFLTADDVSVPLETSLCGSMMAACHSAAATTAILLGQTLPMIAQTLGQVRQLPGRMQSLGSMDGPTIVLDVAGTPQRMASALRSARMAKRGNVRCVLALTGHESTSDLMEYGRLAEKLSGHVVLTCHPRVKNQFLELAHGVLDGVQRCAAFRWIADWQRAVEWSVLEAAHADTVMLLGGFHAADPNSHRRDLSTLVKWVETARTQRSKDDVSQAAQESTRPHFRVVG